MTPAPSRELRRRNGLVDHGQPGIEKPAVARGITQLSSAECRVGNYHLSGVRATTYQVSASCSATDATTWCPVAKHNLGTVGGFAVG